MKSDTHTTQHFKIAQRGQSAFTPRAFSKQPVTERGSGSRPSTRRPTKPPIVNKTVPKAAILQQFLRKDRTVLPANKKQDLPQANYKKGRDKPIVMSLYRPVVKKTTVNFKAQVNEDSTTLKSAATPVPIVLTLPTFQQQ